MTSAGQFFLSHTRRAWARRGAAHGRGAGAPRHPVLIMLSLCAALAVATYTATNADVAVASSSSSAHGNTVHSSHRTEPEDDTTTAIAGSVATTSAHTHHRRRQQPEPVQTTHSTTGPGCSFEHASICDWAHGAEFDEAKAEAESRGQGRRAADQSTWVRSSAETALKGTSAAYDGTYFMLLAEPPTDKGRGSTRYLTSPVLSETLGDAGSVSFVYRVSGNAMGVLSFEAEARGRWSTLWSRRVSPPQQAEEREEYVWTRVSFELPPGATRVRFKGTWFTGGRSTGGMSVDAVTIARSLHNGATAGSSIPCRANSYDSKHGVGKCAAFISSGRFSCKRDFCLTCLYSHYCDAACGFLCMSTDTTAPTQGSGHRRQLRQDASTPPRRYLPAGFRIEGGVAAQQLAPPSPPPGELERALKYATSLVPSS